MIRSWGRSGRHGSSGCSRPCSASRYSKKYPGMESGSTVESGWSSQTAPVLVLYHNRSLASGVTSSRLACRQPGGTGVDEVRRAKIVSTTAAQAASWQSRSASDAADSAPTSTSTHCTHGLKSPTKAELLRRAVASVPFIDGAHRHRIIERPDQETDRIRSAAPLGRGALPLRRAVGSLNCVANVKIDWPPYFPRASKAALEPDIRLERIDSQIARIVPADRLEHHVRLVRHGVPLGERMLRDGMCPGERPGSRDRFSHRSG